MPKQIDHVAAAILTDNISRMSDKIREIEDVLTGMRREHIAENRKLCQARAVMDIGDTVKVVYHGKTYLWRVVGYSTNDIIAAYIRKDGTLGVEEYLGRYGRRAGLPCTHWDATEKLWIRPA